MTVQSSLESVMANLWLSMWIRFYPGATESDWAGNQCKMTWCCFSPLTLSATRESVKSKVVRTLLKFLRETSDPL
jgi:hypothetical protein